MVSVEPSIVDLKVIPDRRGDIVVGEIGEGLPFVVRRFFFLTSGIRISNRGGHAHRLLEQFLICVRGIAKIEYEHDGFKAEVELAGYRQNGFYAPRMTWLDVTLWPRSELLVLASSQYLESDYIRDKADFLAVA